jgi:hypothetical protein
MSLVSYHSYLYLGLNSEKGTRKEKPRQGGSKTRRIHTFTLEQGLKAVEDRRSRQDQDQVALL